jgi:sulfur-oxidizing protein SoxA
MTVQWRSAILISGVIAVLGTGLVLGQGWDISRYEAEGKKSGYLYMDEGTRSLQDDDFLNPGMFAVDAGRALWERPDPVSGESCASCHGDAKTSMRGVAARYPVYDPGTGGIVNLELRINQMLTEAMGAEPLPYESDDLLALTAFIAYQSRGMPIDVAIEGPAAPFFEAGKAFFFERRGQLDLNCSQCHDDYAGEKLRGDLISEGHVTGFPIFRLLWDEMGSRHRMFQWCNISVRAEPYAFGSPEYLNLELYVAWRSQGLLVEGPAVRR